MAWFGFNCFNFINDQSFGLHAHGEEESTGDSHDHDHSGEDAFIWKAMVVLASIYGFYLFEILTHLGLKSKVGVYNLSGRPVQRSVSDRLASVEHEKCEVFARGGYSTDAWLGRCGSGVENLTLFKISLRQNDFTKTECEIFRPYLRHLTQNQSVHSQTLGLQITFTSFKCASFFKSPINIHLSLSRLSH